MKMVRYRKVLPAVLGILVLFISAFSFAPRGAAFVQTTATPTPASRPLPFPLGFSEGEKATLQSLYDFSPDISPITPGSLSASDRTALDVMWAQNYNILQMLRAAMNRSKNLQMRAHIRLLYEMRSKDQQLLNQLEKQVSPISGTATPGVTTVPTGVATTAPTSTTAATTAPTSTTAATTAPTEAATTAPSPTAEATANATIVATAPVGYPPVPTATEAAGYPAVPTAGATMETTGTPQGNLSAENTTNGRPVSLQNVPILPNTALGQLGFHSINLEGAFLDKITRVPGNLFDAAFSVQMTSALNLGQDTAGAVRTSSTNAVLQNVASHLQKENSLDLLLLQVLGDRIFFNQSLNVQFPGVSPQGVQNQSGKSSDQSDQFELH